MPEDSAALAPDLTKDFVATGATGEEGRQG